MDRCLLSFFFFFFQAEDGIRDLVRSRGLGDVYKRQILGHRTYRATRLARTFRKHDEMNMKKLAAVRHDRNEFISTAKPVSYTHLTLPTSDLV